MHLKPKPMSLLATNRPAPRPQAHFRQMNQCLGFCSTEAVGTSQTLSPRLQGHGGRLARTAGWAYLPAVARRGGHCCLGGSLMLPGSSAMRPWMKRFRHRGEEVTTALRGTKIPGRSQRTTPQKWCLFNVHFGDAC